MYSFHFMIVNIKMTQFYKSVSCVPPTLEQKQKQKFVTHKTAEVAPTD